MRWLLLAGAIAPILLAFSIQKRHWINIPIWDEWDTPGIALLHHAQHTLSWEDLFSQHNESRKVVPRLIHIGMASMAGWDVRQGMALTLLGVVTASAFALVYLRRRAPDSPFHAAVAWLLMNLLLFAPSQYENFLSGFAYEILIPFLCLFACCSVNLSRSTLLAKTACNSLLALISTYTFAHGMLLWFIALPLPTRQERPRKTLLFLSYALYAIIAITSVVCYFVGYVRPDIAPFPGVAHIPHLLDFIVVWLGSILRSPLVNPRLAGAIFTAVIFATVVCTWWHLRTHKGRWQHYYPWLALLAFALASGAMTAIGRVTIGVDSVFNPGIRGFSGVRYNLTSVFAYVAIIGLLFNLYLDRIRPEPVWRRRFLIGFAAGCLLLAGAWIGMFSNEWIRVKQFQANRRRARTAIIWSNALPENPEILLAYPYPQGFGKRVEEMRAAGLIRLPNVSDALGKIVVTSPGAGTRECGRVEVCVPLPPDYFRFGGWVRSPAKPAAADYVVLGWEDPAQSFHPLTAITAGQVRSDVAATYGPASLKAGFDQDIEISKLPPEAVAIKGWAIDWEAQQACPIEGLQLDRPRP